MQTYKNISFLYLTYTKRECERERERQGGGNENVQHFNFNSIFIRFVSSNLEFLFAILVQLSV